MERREKVVAEGSALVDRHAGFVSTDQLCDMHERDCRGSSDRMLGRISTAPEKHSRCHPVNSHIMIIFYC